MRKAGDPRKRQEVAAAIKAMQVETVAGPIAFNPATNVAIQSIDHVPVSLWRIWGGERLMIGPAKHAAAELRLPPWMSR